MYFTSHIYPYIPLFVSVQSSFFLHCYLGPFLFSPFPLDLQTSPFSCHFFLSLFLVIGWTSSFFYLHSPNIIFFSNHSFLSFVINFCFLFNFLIPLFFFLLFFSFAFLLASFLCSFSLYNFPFPYFLSPVIFLSLFLFFRITILITSV